MRTGDLQSPSMGFRTRLIARIRAVSWLPALPIVLAPILLFANSLFTGQVLFWGTPSLQFVPWRAFAWEQLLSGELPLWNALNGMGAPLAANYQIALFYPPGWLSYLFAAVGGIPALAWSQTLLIVLHLIFAGLGMAALARRYRLSILAQVIAGLSFSLSGYLVARVEFFSMIWAGAWLPWILLASSRIAAPDLPDPSAPRRPVVPVLVVTAAMQLLSGHAQLTFYTLVLAGAWVAVGGWQGGRLRGMLRSVLRFGGSVGLAAAVAAVQLIPTFEYLRESHRAAAVEFEFALTYSLWPWRLLGFSSPNFFGNPATGDFNAYANFWEGDIYSGFLPLALAVSTLFWLVNRQKRAGKPIALVVFLWGLIVIGTVLALGKFTPLYPWLYNNVPTFDMFQAPARFMIWPAFAIALLAGLAADRWRPAGERARKNLRRGIAAALAIVLAGVAGWILLRDIRLPMFAATSIIGLWALGTLVLALTIPSEPEGKARNRWVSLVIVFTAIDMIIAGWGLNPVTRATIYAPGEVARQGDGRIYLPPDDEYVLKFQRFFRFEDFQPIDDWVHVRTTLLPNINLLDGIPSVNNFDPMVPARYTRWMDALAELQPDEQTPWLQAMDVALVERVDVNAADGVRFQEIAGGERASWWGCATPVTGEQAAWKAVEQRMAGVGDCLVIEGVQPRGEYSGSMLPEAGSVRIDEQRANRIVLQVEAGQPGWLRLADVWYPGWKAFIGGHATPILRADYLFRAVFVPAGEQTVVFRYEPLSYRFGALVTTLGLIAIVVVSFLYRKQGAKYN